MKKTIMIIEDDDSFRDLLKTYLEDIDFNVLAESNGEHIGDIYKTNDIDLFIIDVLLPRKNGFAIVKELKEIVGEGEFSFIMMSGFYKGYKHKNDAIGNLGAKAYLEKPFDFENDLKPVLKSIFKDCCKKDLSSLEIDSSELLDSVSSMMIEEDEVPIFSPIKDEESEVYEEESELGKSIFFQEEEEVSGEYHFKKDYFGENIFPKLLLKLNKKKVTGELYIKNLDKKTKKLIYFKDGVPIFVKSTLVSECLGNILIEERLISTTDKEKSLRLMKKTRKPQGLVLREMKALTLPNLKYGLRKQQEVKLKEIFSWSNFKYQFKATSKLKTPPIIHEVGESIAYSVYSGVTEFFSRNDAKIFYKLYAKKLIKKTTSKYNFLPGELFDDEIDFLNSLTKGVTLAEAIKDTSDKESSIKQVIAFYFLEKIKL